MKKIFTSLFAVTTILTCCGTFPAQAADKPAFDFSAADAIPSQSGGRVKPFSSTARETVLFVTGKMGWEKQKAVPILWQWYLEPEKWEIKPLIMISEPLRERLRADPNTHRVSPKYLSLHEEFIARAEQTLLLIEEGEEPDPLDKKEVELYHKMNLFYRAAHGETWNILPGEKWQAVSEIKNLPAFQKQNEAWDKVLSSARAHDQNGFNHAIGEFIASLNLSTEQAFRLEIHYNRLKPFRWAWVVCLFATIFLAIYSGAKKNLFLFPGLLFTVSGFALAAYGFALRCIIAGRPPVSNMYESVIWVSWGALLFSLILFAIYRSSLILLASTLLATLGLLVADLLPAALDPSITPLEPVLRSNLWLTVHVLTITLSYGVFLLAFGLGHAQLFIYAFAPQKKDSLQALNNFLYRSLQVGVILLASGTILGGVWANYSWGRFWGWDPKETWALIALLGYLILLHGRYAGWIKPFGLALGAVLAFSGILMAWYGVNFVLARGLHSYGFGGGGANKVLYCVAADLLLAAFLTWRYKRNLSVPAPVKTS